MSHNIKYTPNIQSRVRKMDLTVEGWLEMYSNGRVQNEDKPEGNFTNDQLRAFAQLIVNDVAHTPTFLVFEKDDYYLTYSVRLMQFLYYVMMMLKDENVDARAARRILSHRLNVILVEASSELGEKDVNDMKQFYL